MKFTLDTNDFDSIQFDLTDEDKIKTKDELMEDFEYAMSSFYISFCVKNNWSTALAKEMKQSIFTKIDRHIANMLSHDILEPATEIVDEQYIDELKTQMAKADFSDDEIAQMVELVKEYGSIEKASEYLSSLASEQGEK